MGCSFTMNSGTETETQHRCLAPFYCGPSSIRVKRDIPASVQLRSRSDLEPAPSTLMDAPVRLPCPVAHSHSKSADPAAQSPVDRTTRTINHITWHPLPERQASRGSDTYEHTGNRGGHKNVHGCFTIAIRHCMHYHRPIFFFAAARFQPGILAKSALAIPNTLRVEGEHKGWQSIDPELQCPGAGSS